MKTYFILINGYGEGCDYTIGCNTAYTELKAESMGDAEKKAMAYLEESWGIGYNFEETSNCDIRVENIYIMEVAEEREIKIKAPIEKAYALYCVTETEKNERAKYEELKRKYGGDFREPRKEDIMPTKKKKAWEGLKMCVKVFRYTLAIVLCVIGFVAPFTLWEYIGALAVAVGAIAWFCIPMFAYWVATGKSPGGNDWAEAQ